VIRLRSIVNGIPLRHVILLGCFTLFVVASSFLSALDPLESAHRCMVDWDSAISARESGASDYAGPCAQFGGFGAPDGVPEDFERIRSDWERKMGEEYSAISRDLWGTSGRSLGGLPLVLFALLTGSLITGTMMGSGTTAWSLANGWSRPTWIWSLLALVTAVILAVYLLLTIGFGLGVLLRIESIGLHATVDLPDLGVLAPIPGLLFYGLVGVGSGLIAARGEAAALGALTVAVGEYAVSQAVARVPFLPSSLHQVSLGTSESSLSTWIASLGLLGATALLGVALFGYFVAHRDVPDRPA